MFFQKKDKGDLKGKRYEKKVVRILKRNKIKVLSTNKEIYEGKRRITDIDIETKHANIETKIGEKPVGLELQLKKYCKYSKKEAIGMAPNLNNRERSRLNSKGFNVFSKEKNLVKYLKEKEMDPSMTKVVSDPKKNKRRRRK